MISFDVGDGSGGNVDLSPIYKTLQILNVNTESIWNYVTNMTGTTTLSIPYLETYRTQDEMYMYNITGDLTNINYSGNKIVRGFMDSVYQKSLYALDLDIDYIESMRSCTFNGGTWNNAVSLRGGWFAYNDFSGNGKVSINANVLAHNIFDSIKSVSINALNLHTILSNEANSFVNISYLNITCNTIKIPLIIANELNLKCREMYSGGIFGGIYHNVNAVSISTMIFSQIENLNMTGQSMVSCALMAFDFCNLKYNIMASNQILTASDLNISCRLASDILIKSISDLEFNVNSIYSLYISHDDMVKLNFYYANSISIECPGECDICLNGKSLELMTVSNSNVIIHGSVKTLNDVQFSEGKVNLTCDLLDMCTLYGVEGVISAKTVNLCEFSRCNNLSVYADVFQGEIKKCYDISFFLKTLKDIAIDSVSTMFFSWDNLYTHTVRPYINAAYLMTLYCDLQDLANTRTDKVLSLLQGQNWIGTLWLKSGIREAIGTLSNLSLAGITITQDYGFNNCPVMFNYVSGVY